MLVRSKMLGLARMKAAALRVFYDPRLEEANARASCLRPRTRMVIAGGQRLWFPMMAMRLSAAFAPDRDIARIGRMCTAFVITCVVVAGGARRVKAIARIMP